MKLESAPFFIVGSGRSGTTLLRQIICGHSRLHVPQETNFITSLVASFPLDSALTPAQVAHAVEMIVTHRRWPYMGISAVQIRDMAAALAAPRLADVIDLVYRLQLAEAGKSRLGDKTHEYIDIVPQLAILYPSSRFVHLIRDGHDVAMSLINVGWGQAYQGNRFDWTRSVRFGQAYQKSSLAKHILELRYEDLVRDTEAVVRRACDFLGEEFEPAMLERKVPLDSLEPAEWHHIHRKLAGPMLVDSVSVWRRQLSTVECFLLESSLYHDLERLGYPLRFAAVPWRPVLAITGAVLHALGPLLDRLLPALRRRKYVRPIYI